MDNNSNSLLLGHALRRSLKGYNFSKLRHDIIAAFVVSLVALPLSMALSIAVGLPPEHGLYTAIVAGITVPLLGGSKWQVSGPTAAFIVILAPIVSDYGLRGIIWAGIIAGFMLFVMGVTRFGRLINYVPYPVTTGFTAGIAVVLAVLSLNDFLGLGIASLGDSFTEKLVSIGSNLGHLNIYASLVGLVTLLLLFFAGKVIKFLPSTIVAVLFGTLLAMLLNHLGFNVVTIGDKFSYINQDGLEVSGIPPFVPKFGLPSIDGTGLFVIPSLAEFRTLLFPAFAIAMLAALESLLSATVADSMAGTKHNPNAELCAIGIGNILSAFASGIPATGAIARTSVNINSGAKSPLSSSIHAGFIMLFVIILAPYISKVPMAALAALLIHTAYRMSHYKQFIRTIQIAHKSDVMVLLVCFTFTVFIDMVAGVGIGMVLASLLLIKRVTELTEVKIETSGVVSKSSKGIRRKLPKGAMLYRINGPLFFGTIEKAFDRYQFTHDYISSLVLDISGVPFIDMTGLVALKSMLRSIASEKRQVHIICKSRDVVAKIKLKIADHKVQEYICFYQSFSEYSRVASRPPRNS